jgi:DinB superfamily
MAGTSAVQVHADVLSLWDEAWPRFSARLEGLTPDEYLWEPVAHCWTVRETEDGAQADWADPDPETPPVTTIAWRLWHIAVDCLDSYSARVFDSRGTEFVDQQFTLDVDEALTALAASGEVFRAGLAERSPESLYDLLGPAWGPYHASTFLALMLHALDEVIHHAAEIALLRDLYPQRLA